MAETSDERDVEQEIADAAARARRDPSMTDENSESSKKDEDLVFDKPGTYTVAVDPSARGVVSVSGGGGGGAVWSGSAAGSVGGPVSPAAASGSRGSSGAATTPDYTLAIVNECGDQVVLALGCTIKVTTGPRMSHIEARLLSDDDLSILTEEVSAPEISTIVEELNPLFETADKIRQKLADLGWTYEGAEEVANEFLIHHLTKEPDD